MAPKKIQGMTQEEAGLVDEVTVHSMQYSMTPVVSVTITPLIVLPMLIVLGIGDLDFPLKIHWNRVARKNQ